MVIELISLVANIILAGASVIALIISIRSLQATQKFNEAQLKQSDQMNKRQLEHNENNSRPIANIILNDYENKLGVYIENVGNGPLIIKEFLAHNDKEGANSLIDLMPSIGGIPYSNFCEEIAGRTLGVKQRLCLIEIYPNLTEEGEELKNFLRLSLRNVMIELEYTDIYNKIYHCSRELSFFGRHFQ